MYKEINSDLTLPHYGFPSIGQYANVISSVIRKSTYTGNDENSDPIYDSNIVKPILDFIGTTKLHGTNGGVIIDFFNKKVWYESREAVLNIHSDNAGFANYMSSIQEKFVEMVVLNLGLTGTDWDPNQNDPDYWGNHVLAIYGEWCGGKISKGTALNKLDKMFVIFSATIRTREKVDSRELDWFPHQVLSKLKDHSIKVYNVYDYETWKISVDFNNFQQDTPKILEITETIENECPIAKALGHSGIGEGIVFKCITPSYNNSDFWFKSKGEKHAKKKEREIKLVDSEKENAIICLANKVTPSWRLEQMFNQVFDILNDEIVTTEKLGDFIKAVNADIIKEETLALEEAGLTFSNISKYVSKISRDYFFQIQAEMLNGN